MAFFTKESLLVTYAYLYLVMEKHGMLDHQVEKPTLASALAMITSKKGVNAPCAFGPDGSINGKNAQGTFPKPGQNGKKRFEDFQKKSRQAQAEIRGSRQKHDGVTLITSHQTRDATNSVKGFANAAPKTITKAITTSKKGPWQERLRQCTQGITAKPRDQRTTNSGSRFAQRSSDKSTGSSSERSFNSNPEIKKVPCAVPALEKVFREGRLKDLSDLSDLLRKQKDNAFKLKGQRLQADAEWNRLVKQALCDEKMKSGEARTKACEKHNVDGKANRVMIGKSLLNRDEENEKKEIADLVLKINHARETHVKEVAKLANTEAETFCVLASRQILHGGKKRILPQYMLLVDCDSVVPALQELGALQEKDAESYQTNSEFKE